MKNRYLFLTALSLFTAIGSSACCGSDCDSNEGFIQFTPTLSTKSNAQNLSLAWILMSDETDSQSAHRYTGDAVVAVGTPYLTREVHTGKDYTLTLTGNDNLGNSCYGSVYGIDVKPNTIVNITVSLNCNF